MISSALRNWQQENRFRTGGDAVYGVYQSVGFSVVDEDGGKLFVFMLSGSDSAYDSMEDMLAAQSGALSMVQVGDVENYLALFYDESSGMMAPSLMNMLLDFVAANFRSCGFRAPNVCVKCGAPANKRSFLNNMVQPMCASCRDAEKSGGARPAAAAAATAASFAGDSLVPQRSSYDESYDEYAGMENQPRRQMPEYDNRYDQTQTRVPQNEMDNGTVGKGILGALLGSMAGMIPFFISALLNFELAVLCCLAGVGAVWGYVTFGGLRNKSTATTWAIVIPEIVSIISVLFVGMMDHAKSTIGDTFAYFTANIPWLNLVMAVLGVVLGVALIIEQIVKYTVITQVLKEARNR